MGYGDQCIIPLGEELLKEQGSFTAPYTWIYPIATGDPLEQ